jgi:hypothetical protein
MARVKYSLILVKSEINTISKAILINIAVGLISVRTEDTVSKSMRALAFSAIGSMVAIGLSHYGAGQVASQGSGQIFTSMVEKIKKVPPSVLSGISVAVMYTPITLITLTALFHSGSLHQLAFCGIGVAVGAVFYLVA